MKIPDRTQTRTSLSLSSPPSPARYLAAKILNRFETSGAYVNLLGESPGRSRSTPRDRTFTHLLTMGVLKNRTALDWVLSQFCAQPLGRLHRSILNVLRLGAYELLHLPDKPAAVVVHEYVNLARQLGHEGTARLTNAVLRRVAESGKAVAFPTADQDPVRAMAVLYSHPEWLVARWVEHFGERAAEQLCQCDNSVAPVCLRINTLKVDLDEATEALTAAGVAFRKSVLTEECLIFDSPPSHTGFESFVQMPGFTEGWFAVQDEAAQLAGSALNPRPGEVVVDACAAPGGKTTHLAARMKNEGSILAIDTHAHRLRLVEENCTRLGVMNVTIRAGDFREVALELSDTADACLVDAPCSGTGVLRRKPDMRWRRKETELERLSELQLQLLLAAASVVKPGGRILYSTCSLEPEENTQVVSRFLDLRHDFRLWPFNENPTLPAGTLTDEGFLFCIPHHQKTDGGFAARLLREVE